MTFTRALRIPPSDESLKAKRLSAARCVGWTVGALPQPTVSEWSQAENDVERQHKDDCPAPQNHLRFLSISSTVQGVAAKTPIKVRASF
jgi:hypothetical protein